MSNFIDLTGQRFGRWTVLERASNKTQPNGKQKVMWKCRCDCGTIKNVPSVNLRNGESKSCGCLYVEKCIEMGHNNRKYNKYELYDDYVVGYLSTGNKFYIDIKDYDLIKDYYWSESKNHYVVHYSKEQTSKYMYMHRILFKDIKPFPQNVVDHINHNTLDNRRCNLRVVTQMENMKNQKIRTTNKTGVTGVTYRPDMNKWEVTIGVNYCTIHVGIFENFDEAVEARKQAENKYFKEYSFETSSLIAEQNGFVENSI